MHSQSALAAMYVCPLTFHGILCCMSSISLYSHLLPSAPQWFAAPRCHLAVLRAALSPLQRRQRILHVSRLVHAHQHGVHIRLRLRCGGGHSVKQKRQAIEMSPLKDLWR
jgi:hypothetical protein